MALSRASTAHSPCVPCYRAPRPQNRRVYNAFAHLACRIFAHTVAFASLAPRIAAYTVLSRASPTESAHIPCFCAPRLQNHRAYRAFARPRILFVCSGYVLVLGDMFLSLRLWLLRVWLWLPLLMCLTGCGCCDCGRGCCGCGSGCCGCGQADLIVTHGQRRQDHDATMSPQLHDATTTTPRLSRYMTGQRHNHNFMVHDSRPQWP